MTPIIPLPDSVTLDLARRTPYRYSDIHYALAVAAEVGIEPEKAARLVELVGPGGLLQFVQAYKGSLAYDAHRLRRALRSFGDAIAGCLRRQGHE